MRSHTGADNNSIIWSVIKYTVAFNLSLYSSACKTAAVQRSDTDCYSRWLISHRQWLTEWVGNAFYHTVISRQSLIDRSLATAFIIMNPSRIQYILEATAFYPPSVIGCILSAGRPSHFPSSPSFHLCPFPPLSSFLCHLPLPLSWPGRILPSLRTLLAQIRALKVCATTL